MKVCIWCKQNKENEGFWWRNKSKGITHSRCIPCQKKYQKEYYDKNSERVNKVTYARRNRRICKLRAFINSIKLSGCSRCDEKRIPVLQFHHKNPSEKEFNIAEALVGDCSRKRVVKEISKCEVLCANCHFMEHYNIKNDSKNHAVIAPT